MIDSAKLMIKTEKQFSQREGCEKCVEICQMYRAKMEEFTPMLPMILALRNPGMRDRHWEDLSQKLADVGGGELVQLEPETLTLRVMTEKHKMSKEDVLPSVMAVAETILAEVALPAVVCDSKSPFVLLAANDAWLDATVLTKGDVLGRTHSVIQGPLTERAQIDVILKATAAKTPKFSVRLINYTSVGRPFENILTVHRCHRGGAHGTTCVVRDMLLAVSQIRYLDDQEVKVAEEQCGGMYNS